MRFIHRKDSDDTHVGHDSAERGQKGHDEGEGPQEVGFFDKSLRPMLLEVIKSIALTTLILCTFILAILSLYWAVLFHVEQNTEALKVWVVNFDGQVDPYMDITPVVGPELVDMAIRQNNMPDPRLTYEVREPREFGLDPMNVRTEIFNQKAWAAVIVNANATALLQDAVQYGNAAYDPMGIAQIVYVQARDDSTYNNYILPMLHLFQVDFQAKFGAEWMREVLTNASTDANLLANLANAPQALSPAVGFSTFNLRPFTPAAATPSVTIGLIYLIIIAFFSFSFYMGHHQKLQQPSSKSGGNKLRFSHFVVWRIVVSFIAYFFLSLCYSLVSLAFQIDFFSPPGPTDEMASPATQYGHASFVVYWMLNFVGMGALGLACENVAMIVGQPWAALWLIFWVISNVATSFYNLDLAPRFYHWGYAWPLHNIVEAARTILFNTHSRIPQNFGVLLGWVAGNLLFFPFCCYFMRWKTQRSQRKEKEKKEMEEESS